MHHLIDVMGVSERFACRVTGQHRTTQRRQPANSTPADPDAGLRDFAKAHPRWGIAAPSVSGLKNAVRERFPVFYGGT